MDARIFSRALSKVGAAMHVITGEAIAASSIAERGLARLTALPRTPAQALLVVTSYAVVTGWIHWGFGLRVERAPSSSSASRSWAQRCSLVEARGLKLAG